MTDQELIKELEAENASLRDETKQAEDVLKDGIARIKELRKERDEWADSYRHQLKETFRLKAVLGQVKHWEGSVGFGFMDPTDESRLTLGESAVIRLRDILSTAPEVLAVVEGWQAIGDDIPTDDLDFLYNWVGSTQHYRPVTVVVLAKGNETK